MKHAPLLGVNGACFIGHGRSNVKAVRNAIKAAHDFVQRRIPDKIRAKAITFAPPALTR
jgi:glycerol-3-phosphate acyltransferase PlsX